MITGVKTMEFIEIMLLAATWMDLEIVILSEIKDRYHMISLICGI